MCDHGESLYGRCVSCGMTWETQARYPIGGHASTTVHGVASSERVVGEIIGHKRGMLMVRTEYHGILCVPVAKAEPVDVTA